MSSAKSASSVAYLDASALVKLVVDEDESHALRRAASDWPRRVTSRIAVTETLRAVRRRDPGGEPLARRLLARLSLLTVSDRVLMTAAGLAPLELRSIDAIHVATALRVRTALTAFVSYDARQLAAAAKAGLPTASPR